MKISNNYFFLFFALILFLFINIFLLYYANGLKSFLMGADSYSYINPALNFLENGNLQYSNGELMHNNTPLYSIFLSIFILIDKDFYYLYIILSQLIMLLLIAVITVKSFNIKSIFIKNFFFILIIFNPNLVISCHLCQTEILYTLLFILSFYFLLNFINNNNFKNLFFCSVFIGLATLTRPIGVYIFYIFTFILLLNIYLNNKSKYMLLKFLSFILIFFVILAIWSIRNYYFFGIFFISSNSGYYSYDNLIQLFKISYNLSESDAILKVNDYYLSLNNNLDINSFCIMNIRDLKCKEFFFNGFISYVINSNFFVLSKALIYSFVNTYLTGGATNFSNYLNLGIGNNVHSFYISKLSFNNLLILLQSFNIPYLLIFIMTTLYSILTKIIALMGFIYLLINKNYKILFILITILTTYTILFLFVGNSRFRVPLEPLILFFTINGLLFLRIIKK